LTNPFLPWTSKIVGKTFIIITHRLQAIQNVDKIIVVKGGRIVDQGEFSYLMEKCGYFKELWNNAGNENNNYSVYRGFIFNRLRRKFLKICQAFLRFFYKKVGNF